VAIAPTVVPNDVDPSNSERRRLGATFTIDLERFSPG
jgi:hypothetical protein